MNQDLVFNGVNDPRTRPVYLTENISQSKYRKDVVYSTVLHLAFPSWAAGILC